MAKHELWELQQMQSLSLRAKVQMTITRIRAWVEEYGEDGVYIAFSGGLDSRVLLHIARSIYPDLQATFSDTGLEFPEIRSFVKSFDNVEWLKPKISFKEVIQKYGYQFISKEVSESVDESRKYLKILTDRQTDRQTDNSVCSILPQTTRNRRIQNQSTNSSTTNFADRASMLQKSRGGTTTSIVSSEDLENMPIRMALLMGMLTKDNKKMENIPEYDRSMYSQERYKFLLEAPFNISSKCCNVMKKQPFKAYERRTGRRPITAQMADESRLRTQQWMNNGCNGFDMKHPISNPMSFWTKQDVLLYAKINNLDICSVYGEIVKDYKAMGQVEGQLSFADLMQSSEQEIFELGKVILKTTGCDRTGCVFCGYGCHLEKQRPNRFELIDIMSNPILRDYCFRGGAFDESDRLWKPDDRGLGYWFVIKWINIHGGFNIYIPEYERYEKEYGNEETRKYLEEE